MNPPPQNESGRAAQRKGRRSPFFLAGLIVVVIVSVVAGIEALRRFKPAANSDAQTSLSAGHANGSFPRELRDAGGTALNIKARPQRIASQTLGTDEILLAICAPERLVAFSKFARDPKYSNVVDEAQRLSAPSVQNAEDILQLRPDLIFVASYSLAETVEQLKSAGAPVFRFADFNRIEDIKRNIRIIGYATGDDDRAEALVKRMDKELAAIRARIPANAKPPRVMSYGSGGYTAGANTLFDDIVRAAGAINVTAENGIDGFKKISAEQVAAWQPDFIVAGADDNTNEDVKKQLLANPAIASTGAAREGHVVTMDTRYFLTVSHHIVRAVESLANDLYPNTAQTAR
ncbi:MAG: ABC transporter substrate-binding protein [Pyrinomonadaceae bacterium]